MNWFVRSSIFKQYLYIFNVFISFCLLPNLFCIEAQSMTSNEIELFFSHIDKYNFLISLDTKLDKKNYGPLLVLIGQIRTQGDNSIIPFVFNKKDKSYLAINCKYRTINVADRNHKWKQWKLPSKGFEFDLIEEVCTNRVKLNNVNSPANGYITNP